MLTARALSSLEVLLQRGLAASDSARRACTRLDGKVLAIELTGLPITVYARCTDGRIELRDRHEGVPDARIAGSPVALLAFARRAGAPGGAAGLAGGAVRIDGDAEVAQGFQKLLAAARPDPEEELSRLVGDVAAHRIGRVAGQVLGFGRRVFTTFGQNVAEFLTEEQHHLPPRPEVDEHLAGVDTLREDLDRFTARLDRLEATTRVRGT